MTNLTNRPVYQKGTKPRRIKPAGNRPPTARQLKRWDKIRALGCIICRMPNPHIHHCETGAGGRKDHDKVIGLCFPHHQGKEHGIHGDLGRPKWQEINGTEQELMDKTARLLGDK